MRLGRINFIFTGLGIFSLLCALTIGSRADKSLDLSPVNKWLERMENVQSVEATFVQQKYLRTLRNPLTTNGHLWLLYPDVFRWELGDPPATIAFRNKDVLTILKPKKKQVQRISLVPKKGGEGDAAPAFIHSISNTFPRSMDELKEHFEIMGIKLDGKVYELTLRPRDKKLTVAMRRVLFFIDVEKYYLHGFELQFRDKSRVRTTFTKIKFDPTISAELLKPDLEGYEKLEG